MKKISLLFLLLGLTLTAQVPGSLDTSFNSGNSTNAGFYKTIYDAALLPDGKIMIVGDFISYDNHSIFKIARINTDGSFDPTFNPGTGFGDSPGSPYNSSIRTMAIQPDGKIIAAGFFNNYNGVPCNSVIRINTDGTRDTSFNIDFVANVIKSVLIQNDGKILLGGATLGSSLNPLVVRLNSDGSIDSSFNTGTGVDYYITKMVLQPDGKIIVGGDFSSFNGSYHKGLIRLNPDGTADSSFEIYNGFDGRIYDIKLAPDGSIFVYGSFTTFDGMDCKKIIKLLPGGYRDFSFNISAPLSLDTNGLGGFVLQHNGKLVICSTGYYNSQYIWHILRLNADGTYDASFVTSPGLSDSANLILIQPDGKLLVMGPFLSYNSTGVSHIIRINGDDVLSTTENNFVNTQVYPNPSSSIIHLQGFTETDFIEQIVITDITGKEVMRLKNVTNNINIENLESGMYILQAFSADKKLNTKFIKQ